MIIPSLCWPTSLWPLVQAGLKPKFVDVDYKTLNVRAKDIEHLITDRTKAIVPVHLFGQSAKMEEIIILSKKYNLTVIEDNAQAIGCNYLFSNETSKKTGTIGHIGTTSFFPSKNLGCYGDGGAIFTDDDDLASKMRMIANHGQEKKYYHKVTGCNSRLDSIQAAILNVKLKFLDEYNNKRNKMADKYDDAFKSIDGLNIPFRFDCSDHVFHQYTLKTTKNLRDDLVSFLNKKGIPSMIYYPVPLYKQEAFSKYVKNEFEIKNVENLCETVFSLPIHTEIENSHQNFIIENVLNYFN